MGVASPRKECDTKHAPLIKESISEKIYNSIVKIEIIKRNKDTDATLIGTGFFLKPNEKLKYLITCEHVISEEDINNKKTVKLLYGKKDKEKEINIKLDKNIRYIKTFAQKKEDITFIEIIKDDNISEDKYLNPDLNYRFGYDRYKNQNFYLAGYPRNFGERCISSGKIKEIISDYQFSHTLDTRGGSSGSPICNENCDVIGVHNAGNETENINYGTFIGRIMDYLNREESKLKESKNKEKQKKSKPKNRKKELNQKSIAQQIFQSYEFNNSNSNILYKYNNNEEYQMIKILKGIHEHLLENFYFNNNMLDYRGNKFKGWSIGEKRGNLPYEPPLGWIGFGLKVLDKYDNGDNNWLGNCNSPGEWAVAYYPILERLSIMKNKIIIKMIFEGFIMGMQQICQNSDDKYHPGKLVGRGVYFSPNIEVLEPYTNMTEIYGKNYKIILMVRIKPSAIRGCEGQPYYVVNGSFDEVRPYRILFK